MKYLYSFILGLLVVGCVNPQENQTAKDTTATDTLTRVYSSQQADSFDRQSSSIGQQVYVPVYSHIYQQDRRKTFNLTTTLSIRNADPYRSFTLIGVSYYDSKGNLIQEYVGSDQQISPLASTSFVIEEEDLRGGVGANFIVEWQSKTPIYPPIIEAVNISTSQQQGISFLSVGRVLEERSATTEDGN
jgi:hypothetical protein